MTAEQAAEQEYPMEEKYDYVLRCRCLANRQQFVKGWNARNEQALTEQHTAYLAGLKAAEKPSDAVEFVQWLMKNDYDIEHSEGVIIKWERRYISYTEHKPSEVYAQFLTEKQKNNDLDTRSSNPA